MLSEYWTSLVDGGMSKSPEMMQNVAEGISLRKKESLQTFSYLVETHHKTPLLKSQCLLRSSLSAGNTLSPQSKRVCAHSRQESVLLKGDIRVLAYSERKGPV